MPAQVEGALRSAVRFDVDGSLGAPCLGPARQAGRSPRHAAHRLPRRIESKFAVVEGALPLPGNRQAGKQSAADRHAEWQKAGTARARLDRWPGPESAHKCMYCSHSAKSARTPRVPAPPSLVQLSTFNSGADLVPASRISAVQTYGPIRPADLSEIPGCSVP